MEKKTKFRAKKLDFSKFLPVYRENQIDDLEEAVTASRTVPSMSSGVDKEEEEEHHLQAAINASLSKGSQPVYIPTPDASHIIEDYDSFYSPTFTLSKTPILVKEGNLSEFTSPMGVWYCIDEADESWINANVAEGINELNLEILISNLERLAQEIGFSNVNTSYLVNFEYMKVPLDSLAKMFEYWQSRRMRYPGGVLPTLKFEDVSKTADHYVCFRRRELKLQHRKTRRSDYLCLEKLRRLRSELESIRTLIEMVTKRDKFKKEAFILEGLIFDQARLLERWNTKFHIPVKIGPSVKMMATAYAGSKKRKNIDSWNSSAGGSAALSASAAAKPRRISLIDQFPKVEEFLHRDVDRHQIAKDLFKQIKAELERRIHLDRDFDDSSLEMRVPQAVEYAESFYEKGENGMLWRYRRGRGGRLVIDRRKMCASSHGDDSEAHSSLEFPISFKYFSGPELAICNNSQVQNYNQHYLAATAQITRPIINFAAMLSTSNGGLTPSASLSLPSSIKKKRKIKKESTVHEIDSSGA